jgi:hypothetical protein
MRRAMTPNKAVPDIMLAMRSGRRPIRSQRAPEASWTAAEHNPVKRMMTPTIVIDIPRFWFRYRAT